MLRIVGKGTRSEIDALAVEAISTPAIWEADVTPMPVATESEPTGRPAAVIIAANEAVLLVEAEAHPPSDAAGVAKLLAQAIGTVLARGGVAPAGVLVRHAEVATALGLLMEETPVSHTPVLPMADEFARSFRQQVSGLALPPISQPQTWAAWELAPETLERVFSAAASYYSVAPWQDFGDESPIELALPNGAVWNAVVIGFNEQEFGLVLYESIDDYDRLVHAPSPEIGFSETQSPVIALFFDARADLPKAMRKEFTDAKWKVAGPKGYPSVWVLNTIGGGLSEEYANDLAMTLEVMARFQAASLEDEALLETLATSWTDEISGTVARLIDDEGDYLWDVPELLSPSLAEGARADATARSGTDEDGAEDAATVDRFVAAMKASPANAERTKRDEQDVDFFVQLMHGVQGVRLPSLSELDLRTFLYDLLPRKAMTTKEHGNAIRASLERFFAYLAANEQLTYPWAAAILADVDSFEERWDSFPGRQQNDALADWMGEFFSDLDARVMLPSNELAGLGTWGETQGIAEASMYSLLEREWLIWRDEEIALGHRAPKELWDRLVVRQAEWELAPNARLGGRSPSEEIAKERGTQRRAKPRTTRRR
ncbi:MAG: hypothetical protein ABIT20_04375 [Gemmatimonadaceae bacterium]